MLLNKSIPSFAKGTALLVGILMLAACGQNSSKSNPNSNSNPDATVSAGAPAAAPTAVIVRVPSDGRGPAEVAYADRKILQKDLGTSAQTLKFEAIQTAQVINKQRGYPNSAQVGFHFVEKAGDFQSAPAGDSGHPDQIAFGYARYNRGFYGYANYGNPGYHHYPYGNYSWNSWYYYPTYYTNAQYYYYTPYYIVPNYYNAYANCYYNYYVYSSGSWY